MTKRILVVDDQEGMRDLLADFVDAIGYEPHTVEGGAQALRALHETTVDLVITDLNMPVMDGLELMDEIKTRWSDLPVVIITGYGTFQTEKQVLARGAAGYISKPCTLHRVQSTVESALGVAS